LYYVEEASKLLDENDEVSDENMEIFEKILERYKQEMTGLSDLAFRDLQQLATV